MTAAQRRVLPSFPAAPVAVRGARDAMAQRFCIFIADAAAFSNEMDVNAERERALSKSGVACARTLSVKFSKRQRNDDKTERSHYDAGGGGTQRE